MWDFDQLHQLGVYDLSLNSKELNTTTAFVALPGNRYHGLDFIAQAIAAKAPCVIIDQNQDFSSDQIVVVRVPELIEKLGYFAAAFYNDPSQKLALYAVTGTNGKTSCSQFVAQALTLLNQPCGVIGTLGIGVWPELQPQVNTTPDAVSIQRFLAQCVKIGIAHVCMEASSIALAAHRMQGCIIRSIIFTNLTQDHLDYHQTMLAYAQAKQALFDFPGIQAAVINIDDLLGQKLLTCYMKNFSCWATSTQADHHEFLSSIKSQVPSVVVTSKKFSQEGLQAEIETPTGAYVLTSRLLGAFNLENLLLIFAWLLSYGLAPNQALSIIAQLSPVNGRMATYGGDHGLPLVVVDYAHTPDALTKVLQALRAHCVGRLWCVFGCGGNRDQTKRPLMGKIALEYADSIIVTNDNPREEDPSEIAKQILSDSSLVNNHIILDRAAAITHAINQADSTDIILIAGKGHETYQEIKGMKIDFDDAVWVKNSLAKKNQSPR